MATSEPVGATVYTKSRGFKVDKKKIKRLADEACTRLGMQGFELAVQLVDSGKIQELNAKYRGKDQPTDVLSFPQMNWDEPRLWLKDGALPAAVSKPGAPPQTLGDIVISLPEAEKNAGNIGHGLDREVCFLLVHGLLHLCGHDHVEERDEKIMTKQQQLLMGHFQKEAAHPAWTDCVTKVKS